MIQELGLAGSRLEQSKGEPEGPTIGPSASGSLNVVSEKEVAFRHQLAAGALLERPRRVFKPHVVLHEVTVA